ncbi:MAG: hypothetical protein M0P47_12325 [Bacteroidales bacterium]|nr:hypothetical protein [Bacteroidales bacterium]
MKRITIFITILMNLLAASSEVSPGIISHSSQATGNLPGEINKIENPLIVPVEQEGTR